MQTEDVVMTLLSSLPEESDNLITALESRADELTLKLVSTRLLLKRPGKGKTAHQKGRKEKPPSTPETGTLQVEAMSIPESRAKHVSTAGEMCTSSLNAGKGLPRTENKPRKHSAQRSSARQQHETKEGTWSSTEGQLNTGRTGSIN